MEDLITDLLSQPVDVSDWLPPWVQEVCYVFFWVGRAQGWWCMLACVPGASAFDSWVRGLPQHRAGCSVAEG